jgi:magnesium chelatase subunit I
MRVVVPEYIREVIETAAFLAREDKRVDRRSGVSQRLPITVIESAASNAERRALGSGEAVAVVRVGDVYAALPSLTGKLELEYEGELRGADVVARELIRSAVGKVFSKRFSEVNLQPVVQWFELGGELKFSDSARGGETLAQMRRIQGLTDHLERLGVDGKAEAAELAAAAEFVLEGLWAHKRIGRNEERGFYADAPRAAAAPPAAEGEAPPRMRPRRPLN